MEPRVTRPPPTRLSLFLFQAVKNLITNASFRAKKMGDDIAKVAAEGAAPSVGAPLAPWAVNADVADDAQEEDQLAR